MGESIDSLLKRQDFFMHTKNEYIMEITKFTRLESFKKDTLIAEEGSDANNFYIIRSGSISIAAQVNEDFIQVTTLNDSNIFGWSWMIPPFKWTFSARSLEDSSLISIDGLKLRDLCNKESELGYQLIRKITETTSSRLRKTRQQLADYYKRYNNDLKLW